MLNKDLPKVSIVIVTRNRSAALKRLLTSLRFQTYSNFEIIVVHGPSERMDNTAEVIASYSDINYVSVPFKNIAAARNVGLDLSNGEYLVYLDDDAIPEPDCVNNLIIEMTANVGLVAGMVRNPDGVTFQYKGGGINFLGEPEHFELHTKETPRSFTAIGALFAVKKDVLVSIGGFDEVFSYFLDESEMNLRITMAGYKSLITSKAEIIHEKGRGVLRSSDGLPSSYLGIVRSKIYFRLKYSKSYLDMNDLFNYIKSDIKHLIAGIHASPSLTPERKKSLVESVIAGYFEGISYAKSHSNLDREKHLNDSLIWQIFSTYNRALRIIICARGWSTTDSGIGRWTREMASGLARSGFIVTVISEDLLEHQVSFQDEGFWVHSIPPSLNSNFSLPPHISTRTAAVLLEFQDILMRRGCDIFQFPIWDVEGMEVLEKIKDIKSVVSLHTTYSLTKNDHPEWFVKGKLTKPIQAVLDAESQVLFKATAVLANSDAIVREIKNHYSNDFSEKVQIVPHSVPCQKEALPYKTGIKEIIFIGRLEHRKGIDLFIDAVNILKQEIIGQDFKVSVIGAGTHYWNAYLKLKDVNEIEWLNFKGFVSDDELKEILSERPIVVMPSRFESFGLVALEAMSHGCAVIASAVGGLVEVLSQGKTGKLVQPLEPLKFAEAISELIHDSERRLNLQISGYKSATENFSTSNMIEKLSEFYFRLSGEKERSQIQ